MQLILFGFYFVEFSNSDKTANFFCKVYFAEEFRQLREKIFPAGEDKFIRSLTRCVKFEAKGGKSRSAFCKVAGKNVITCLHPGVIFALCIEALYQHLQ